METNEVLTSWLCWSNLRTFHGSLKSQPASTPVTVLARSGPAYLATVSEGWSLEHFERSTCDCVVCVPPAVLGPATEESTRRDAVCNTTTRCSTRWTCHRRGCCCHRSVTRGNREALVNYAGIVSVGSCSFCAFSQRLCQALPLCSYQLQKRFGGFV